MISVLKDVRLWEILCGFGLAQAQMTVNNNTQDSVRSGTDFISGLHIPKLLLSADAYFHSLGAGVSLVQFLFITYHNKIQKHVADDDRWVGWDELANNTDSLSNLGMQWLSTWDSWESWPFMVWEMLRQSSGFLLDVLIITDIATSPGLSLTWIENKLNHWKGQYLGILISHCYVCKDKYVGKNMIQLIHLKTGNGKSCFQ